MEQQLLWHPSEEFINNSNLKAFEHWLGSNKGLYFDSYSSLWEWSVNDIESFWECICQYFDIIFHTPYHCVLAGDKMPDYSWFEGSTLNYSEHIFRQKSNKRNALAFMNESGEIQNISWEKLEQNVKAIQIFLVKKGIKSGDCVAGFLPNIPEAIYIFLAVNSIGAIWSCCSPDFGTSTVIERFSQIQPKVFFAADGYRYNTKPYDKSSEIHTISESIPSIESTVIIPYLHTDHLAGSEWGNIIDTIAEGPLEFEAVPFSHPIWVLYSSGTTGKPKAITHSHGGVLLEHLKYMAFHNDVHPGEHFFWFTTTGWMMWNFLQASLLMGATAVLYDGSPGYPNMNVLWEFTEKLPINHFGTSAPYLIACMKKGLKPGIDFNLQNLRSIGSTGAPLPPETFKWIYKNVSEELWLCSMSGGTDVCTAFVGGCPYLPVYSGLIQSRGLGCSLKSYNDNGEEVYDQLGEMIIDQPMPCMPIYFWGDDNKERYQNSYFEKYPGKWRHGDWIHLYTNGSLSIHGRSDATLNRKGIRIGTAEIYNVLTRIEGIKDALIINIEKQDGSDYMPLFIVLKDDSSLTDELKGTIKKELKTKCSPRHIPDDILQAPDIPYTLSGKKMEVPVKKILMGMSSEKDLNKDSIRNPEAMDFFLDFSK